MASRISFRKGHEGKKKASVSNSMGISLEELYCKLESDYRISKGRNLYFDFFEAKNDSEKVHFNYERELLLSYKDHFKSFLMLNLVVLDPSSFIVTSGSFSRAEVLALNCPYSSTT